MNKGIKVILLFLILSTISFAQTEETVPSDSISKNTKKASSSEFIFKPSIGLGTGMFSFYGDLYNKHFQAPMLSRIGYDLNFSQKFTDYLQFNFYALFGKLGANERSAPNNRNLNFESQIRVGGINLLYNFGNFLPKNRIVSPYITFGVESFEFLSKTDMFDKNGNRYYYWSDGSIRNIDQNAINAGNAIIIHRDYTYESDVREMNLDGFGKYPERSFAIPVGIGAIFKLSDFWDFKIGTTMHFTFTDYIDGVSNKSIGNRIGNKNNDNFMMSSFSVHYNFGKKEKNGKGMDDELLKEVDYFALDLSDFDNDNVPDYKDTCQGTPPGIAVDEKGCPIDDDNDGIPNFKDKELNSPKNAFVDVNGVQLTDSIIDYQYRYYMDSTGEFAAVEYHLHNRPFGNYSQKEYTIEIGSFKKGLPPELMTKFLSISEISSTILDDSTTVYTAGKFNSLLDAEKRKKQFIDEGIADAKVVYKENGKFIDAPKYSSNPTNASNIKNSATNKTTNTNSVTNNTDNSNNSKANNSSASNNNTNNTTNNTTNNNSVKNNNSNSANKIVSTNTNSNNNASNNNLNTKTNTTTNTDNLSNNAVNTKGVVLRVQLGAYHNRLSKSVFKDIPDLIEIKTDDGLYKYMTGAYTTFDAAAIHKVDMILNGYKGAFIAAYKDGKRVSLTEAGATQTKTEIKGPSDSSPINAVDKTLITFKIQIGVFKNEPPADKKEKFAKIKGTTKEITSKGLNRYVVGPFSDYKKAQTAKNDLIKNYGIDDAFIIAFLKNEPIPVQEALELMK